MNKLELYRSLRSVPRNLLSDEELDFVLEMESEIRELAADAADAERAYEESSGFEAEETDDF